MSTEQKPVPPNMILVWIGRVVSALPVLMLLFSAGMKFTNSPTLTEGMDHLGWPMKYAVALGIIELACTILYVIPQTSVLGAILLTGYLGGATATHLRVGIRSMVLSFSAYWCGWGCFSASRVCGRFFPGGVDPIHDSTVVEAL